MASIEDILDIAEQANIPGTIDEHPNWRRKIPVPLEEFERKPGLKAVAAAFKAAGRGI
jgi:4-alpha-glucanotransferase